MSQAGILNRGVFPPGSVVETIEGNTGGPVGPTATNNIFVVGDGTTIEVAGNPGTNTLTISTTDAVAIQYTTDAGVAVPVAGNLNVFGGTAARDINTSGSGDTIHVDLNNAITLGDLAAIPPATDAITLTTGDLSLDIGNINFFVNGNPTGGSVTYNTTPFMSNFGANSAWLGSQAGGNYTGSPDGCVGIGQDALFNVKTANYNTAIGFISQSQSTVGFQNSSLGAASLVNLVSGSNNIAMGFDSGSNYAAAESENIAIGSFGILGDNGVIRIGANGNQTSCFVAGIDGVNVGSTAKVVTTGTAGTADQLGTANITGAGGIVINTSANQIEIDGSGAGGAGTITGNDGTPEAQVAGNWDILTANSTVLFNANGAGLTLDFSPFNLLLGSSGISVTTAVRNVAGGALSGDSLVDGTDNAFWGEEAGRSATDSSFNVAVGAQALLNLSFGSSNNIAIGYQAINIAPDTIANNVAIGSFALSQLGSGAASNVAIGVGAGINYVSTESNNICITNAGTVADNGAIRIGTNGNQTTCYVAGIDAIDLSTANVVTEVSDQLGTSVLTAGSGISITPGAGVITIAATGGGVTSIAGNTGGAQTGAISLITANSTPIFAGAAGTITLDFNLTDNLLLGATGGSITSGNTNVGYGKLAAASLTSAASSCFIGYESGVSYTTGSNTTAVGAFSMFNSIAGASNNTAIGYSSLYNLAGAGTNNTCLGLNSAIAYTTTESNNIVIGSTGVIADNNRIRIGTNGTHNSCFITGIDTVNVGSVAKVVTMASDQLGTATITAGTGITVTPGANLITISGSGSTNLTVTPVNNAASPYTVLTTDSFLAVNTSGGAVTITLPNAPATGRVFYVKDSNGTAAASNITVTTVGGAVNIDGATSFVMNTAYESINVVFDGTAYEVF